MKKKLQEKIDRAKALKDSKIRTFDLNILSIDPATHLGWAVCKAGETEYEYGLFDFTTKKDESVGMKFIKWETQLKKLCEKYNVNIIVFERVSGRHTNAVISHSKFLNVIEMYCVKNGVEHIGYSAKEIKKFVTGNGNAGKPEMIRSVQKIYGYTGNDDNEADAIGLLMYYKSK